MQNATVPARELHAAVYARVCSAYGVTTPKGLASAMGQNENTVKAWRARGVPLKWLTRVEKDTGRTLDWLRFGADEARFASDSQPRGAAQTAGKTYFPQWVVEPPQEGSALQVRGDTSKGNQLGGLLMSAGARAFRPLKLSMPAGESGGETRDLEVMPKLTRVAWAGGGVKGNGGESHEQIEIAGEMAFSHDWLRHNLGHTTGQVASILVRGNSMAPTLLDGETIIIDIGVDGVDVDGIYVLDVSGRRVVKRVQHLVDGALVLISDNESYQRETIPRDRARDVKIIGRMVWPRVR